MAKKIQAAEIIIKTTDGGSYKVMGAEAEKLAKKLKKTETATRNVDRATKGVTKQSSNSTKEFSKMATMQGGLVSVYATIAAQAFALSAAFEFLKSSMQTRNLIAGQEAFGSVTGTAYASLTANIQNATQGMLSFKAAASSAAIGVAAGLSAGQLENLGKVATNASLALGRDLEDSFNRLIRGVTKAEPELLDELGIILRLENATQKYALSVGKTREQLNAYERTQAVLNDVLDQGERKYAKIQEKMDPAAFAMGQFSKTIDDLIVSFQNFIMKGIIPVLGFFKENAMALVAAIALFITPILRSLLPNLSKGLEESTIKMKSSFGSMKTEFADMKEAMTDLSDHGKDMTVLPAADQQKNLEGLGVKNFGGKNDKGEKMLNKRQISSYRRMMKEKKGIYMRMNREERRQFRMHLNMQEAMLKGHSAKAAATVNLYEKVKQTSYKVTQVVYQGTLTAMKGASVAAAWAMNKAMMAIGFIGMIAMMYSAIKALWDWYKDLDEAAARMRKQTKDTTTAIKELNGELAKMLDIKNNDYLLDLKGHLEQTGQALQSTGVAKQIAAYNRELKKAGSAEAFKESDLGKEFVSLAKKLVGFDEGYAGLLSTMTEGIEVTDTQAASFKGLATDIINASEASKRFNMNQETVNKALDKQIRKFAQLPYQDILDALNSSLEDLDVVIPAHINNTATRLAISTSLIDTTNTTLADQGMNAGANNAKYNKNTWGSQGNTAIMKGKAAGLMGLDEETLHGRLSADDGGTKEVAAVKRVARIFAKTKTLKSMRDKDKKYNSQGYEMLAEAVPRKSKIRAVEAKPLYTEKEVSFITKYWKEVQKLNKTKVDAAAQAGLDADELANYNEETRKNSSLKKYALKLQKSSVKQVQDQLTHQKELVLSQKAGITTEQKRETLNKRITSLGDKVAKAEVEKEAAALAVFAIAEKQNGQQLAKLELQKDEQGGAKALSDFQAAIARGENETVESYIERLPLLKASLDTKEGELHTGIKALANAGTQITIEKATRDIKTEQLELAKALLNYQAQLTNLAWSAAAAARAEKEAKIGGALAVSTSMNNPQALADERRRQLAEIGKRGDAGAAGTGKIGRMEASILNADNGRASLQDQTWKDSVTGKEGGFGKPDYELDGRIKDPANPLQESYNKLLQETLDLKGKINLEELKAGKIVATGNGSISQASMQKGLTKLEFEREMAFSINPANAAFEAEILRLQMLKVPITAKIIEDTKRMSVEQANVNIELELMNGIQDTLGNAFQSMFQSMIDGSKSFGTAMKELAVSVIADLAAMMMKAAALKFMLAMFPGMGAGMSASTANPLTRYGGIVSPSGKSFAAGGVAQGPQSGYQATLHGREAVIPLGNDKSIPVQLSGGGGQNTVNVIVNMSGNGQSQTSSTGDGMQGLGRSIGGLVQQHLQQEMRPGGLLNQQGTKGRR